MCSEAFPDCRSCTDSGCKLCDPSHFLTKEGTCSSEACEIYENGKCVSCNSKAGVQYLLQDGECTLNCQAPFSQINSYECAHPCASDEFLHNGNCAKCDVQNCNSCIAPDTCVECSEGEYCNLHCSGSTPVYDYDSMRCVSECSGQHSYTSVEIEAGKKSPHCRQCESTDCVDCSNSATGSVCNECSVSKYGQPQFAYGSMCFEKCPYGTFNEGMKCSSCSENCHDCLHSNECSYCSRGFSLVNGKCV